jgi:hypothetical protein
MHYYPDLDLGVVVMANVSGYQPGMDRRRSGQCLAAGK